MVSDGAPVDDSTLLQNHSHYMMDHLLDVIAALEVSDDVELHGFGVGYSDDAFYRRSAAVEEPEDVGLTLLGQIERVLAA
jgi:cobaltochelatase CobT